MSVFLKKLRLFSQSTASSIINAITGTGTTNYLSKFTAAGTIGDSQIFDNGSNVGISTTTPVSLLSVYHTRSSTSSGAGIDSINLGGQYSNTAGLYPKVIIYDDGGNIAGIGISAGQIDYIGYSTSVSHVFWAGAIKRVVLGGDGNNGFNIAVPYATIHAKGSAAAGGTYVLKLDNSATTDGLLFNVRDDGNVGVNYAAINDTKFFINGGLTANNIYAFRVDAGAGINVLNVKNNGDFGVGTVPGNKFFVRGSDGNIGINFPSGATNGTKLYIDGGLTAANEFAFRIDGDGNQLFNIRNNGKIDIYGTITPRLQSITSAATVTPTNLNDEVVITAQAVGLTLANPTGTAVQGQSMMIRIKDNATAQTIAYDTQYRAIGVTLPTTTVISKTLYLGLIYNSTDTKWDVINVSLEGTSSGANSSPSINLFNYYNFI